MKNELEKYLQNDTEQLKLFLDLVAAIKTECQFNEGKPTINIITPTVYISISLFFYLP